MGKPGGKPLAGVAGSRVHRARTAFITYLATPQSKRPVELNTLKKLADEFGVRIPDLYGYLAEPGFIEAVVADLTYWRIEVHTVIESVRVTATNPQSPNYLKCVVAYMRIVGHPAADALADLI